MDDPRRKSGTARWTHTCAWNGHELGEAEYVEMSAHERVCRLHHPEFVIWLRDKSKTINRVVAERDEQFKAKGQERLARVLRLFPGKQQTWSSQKGQPSRG